MTESLEKVTLLAQRAYERLRTARFPKDVVLAQGTDEQDGSSRLEFHAFEADESRR